MKINIVASQTTKVTLKLMKTRLMRDLRKRENNSQWLATKRSACDVAKETPEARLDACLFKNELEPFL